MKLRDYQTECIDGLLETMATHKSSLVCMPTGSGKTIVFSHLIDKLCDSNRRALVVAHTDELIGQAWRKIRDITGHEPEIEKANQYADKEIVYDINGKSPTVVTSIQTQNSGRGNERRMTRLSPSEFRLLIIDEAHHAVAASYVRLIKYYRTVNPDVLVLGFTATPDRHDEQALGKVFTSVAYEMEILQAIDRGWLVPIKQRYIEITGLDFSGLTKRKGDFAPGELEQIMAQEEKLQGVADATVSIAGDRQTLIFASGLAHAERLTEIINRKTEGMAFWVHGGTPIEERRQVIRQFRAGSYQYMVNVQVAQEGFDVPGVQLVAVARPTLSRALYAQMVGRGTRPFESLVPELNDSPWPAFRRAAIAESGKPFLEVLDFTGRSGQHKLVHVGDILAGDYSDVVIERAKKNAQARDEAVDMTDELKLAEEELREEAKKKRRTVVAKAKWRSKDIDPFDVYDVQPHRERGWHRGRPATEKQRAVLVRAGIDGAQTLNFTHASQLIEQVIQRRTDGLCTYKQARLLAGFGYDPDITFEEAGSLIDQLAANKWKPL